MIGITTANLNIRTGTNTNYTAIATLPKDTEVEILGQDESTGWYKIKYDMIFAYASNNYINIKLANECDEYLNCVNEQGMKDGLKYVYKFKNCKITAYGGDGSSGCKIPLDLGHTAGSFNLPYGSEVYIPSMKGFTFVDGNGKSVVCDGVFTINDTGIGCTDFDLYMSTSTDYNAEKIFGATRYEDVYVLKFGKGYGYTWSYTQSYEFANKNNTLTSYKKAFKDYIKNGGTLINFLKFKNIDKGIRDSKYWNILNN